MTKEKNTAYKISYAIGVFLIALALVMILIVCVPIAAFGSGWLIGYWFMQMPYIGNALVGELGYIPNKFGTLTTIMFILLPYLLLAFKR